MKRPKRILIVSPHRDDAALSVGLTANHLRARGHAVVVLNCFTISSYAPRSKATSVDDISTIRLNEDRRFVGLLSPGVKLLDLSFREALLRDYATMASLFDSRKLGKNDWLLSHALGRKIARQVRNSWLLTPLALGDHIDHRIAREAIVRAAPSSQVGFYEDLPYAMNLRFEEIRAAVTLMQNRQGTELLPHCVGGPPSPFEKLRLISVYKSQFGRDRLAAMAEYSACGERLWLTKAWQFFLDSITLKPPP